MKNAIMSHTRDIIMLSCPKFITYQIPIYFDVERKLFGKRNTLIYQITNELSDSNPLLQPPRSDKTEHAELFRFGRIYLK